jgi:Rps23 Pro-64 3,4-dihydroxylase Tpa1-like proline 4-hydroxylase
MKELVQAHVFENVDKHREAFMNAKPYRHLVIDNFYTDEALHHLLEEFPSHSATDSIVGDYGKKNAKKGGRSEVVSFGDTYRAWDALIQTPEFLSFLSEVTQIEDLLYDKDYIGAGIHENFEGNRGNIHIDYNHHPKTDYHRRLNMICYISPEWKAEYGGALKVYEDGKNPKEGERKKLSCLPNRCVLFETTERSWHGVESISLPDDKKHLTRKSITTYFYTEDRPDDETAPRHSTIYYPGELPERLVEGYSLARSDINELNNYQKRANALIASLYKEHSRLYEITSKLRHRANQLEKKLAKLEQHKADKTDG